MTMPAAAKSEKVTSREQQSIVVIFDHTRYLCVLTVLILLV